MIKPDLVAPSGLSLAASGSGFQTYSKITGTSFSAPLVAGAIALLHEKCDRKCSPFALRALLMNNVWADLFPHSADTFTATRMNVMYECGGHRRDDERPGNGQ